MNQESEQEKNVSGIGYLNSGPTWSNQYLWRPVLEVITKNLEPGSRIIDMGCGNGATANLLANEGYSVTGIDVSASGIKVAAESYKSPAFYERSVYDDLVPEFGQYDAVVSLEVIEHLYSPRKFAHNVFSILKPGGIAIISTPFHGYWKNLAIALAGKCDAHWTALWEGGHIKFWSESTLRTLLEETGFQAIRFSRAGRVRLLAKSMIVLAVKSE